MTRKIKFRGLRTDGNGWVYGFYALWQNEHMIFPESSIGRPRKVIPETVGQFTGLKDKNGTEIYEGIKSLKITLIGIGDGFVDVLMENGQWCIYDKSQGFYSLFDALNNPSLDFEGVHTNNKS